MTAKPTSHNQLLCFSPCPGVSLSPLFFIPSQIVIWLPALCRKMDVPYCIVKGKARLGQVVHKKTATVLAFTDVKKEDQSSFNKLTESIRNNFNERADTVRILSRGNHPSCCHRFRNSFFCGVVSVPLPLCQCGLFWLLLVVVYLMLTQVFCRFISTVPSPKQFRKTWGGGIMGSKTIHKVAIYEKNRLRELAAREGK